MFETQDKIETISINGVDYVQAKDAGYKPSEGEILRILVSDDRGLCIVGHCDINCDGDWITINDGRCIIRWGTDKHLAQLAARGPMENTVLGFEHIHEFAKIHVGLSIPCIEEKWWIK